jgi:hypothetical protein
MISCQSADQKRLNAATVAQQVAQQTASFQAQQERAEVQAARLPKMPAVCAQIVTVDAKQSDTYQVAADKLLLALTSANNRIRYCYNWYYKQYEVREANAKRT